MSSRPHRVRIVPLLKPGHALGRIAVAVIAGIAAALPLSRRYSGPLATIGGWDFGALVLLALAWSIIVRCDGQATARRAAADDPGRTAVYALTLLTSGTSLFAATVLVGGAKGIAPYESRELVAFCLLTVALSWTLTHTAFALRYAHLFYRADREGVGGVEFPGGRKPSYFDFAYLAFTVGMTFQVSDTAISSAQIRRVVLLHATLSFAYNTAILAFVLNLVFAAAT